LPSQLSLISEDLGWIIGRCEGSGPVQETIGRFRALRSLRAELQTLPFSELLASRSDIQRAKAGSFGSDSTVLDFGSSRIRLEEILVLYKFLLQQMFGARPPLLAQLLGVV
jgi:hypothetical protein